jgi:hypothetical protein
MPFAAAEGAHAPRNAAREPAVWDAFDMAVKIAFLSSVFIVPSQ